MSHILPNHKSKFDKSLDEFMGIKLDELDIGVINTLALKTPASLLPILARSFDVDISDMDELRVREHIKNAFEIHYYSGTFYALNKALKAFFGDSKVIEWFDYGSKAYHFKLELEIANSGIDKEKYEQIDSLVEEFKNVRSVLESISLIYKVKKDEYNASASISGEWIDVLPFVPKNIELNLRQNIATTVVFFETIKSNLVTKKPETSLDIEAGVTLGLHATQFIEIKGE